MLYVNIYIDYKTWTKRHLRPSYIFSMQNAKLLFNQNICTSVKLIIPKTHLCLCSVETGPSKLLQLCSYFLHMLCFVISLVVFCHSFHGFLFLDQSCIFMCKATTIFFEFENPKTKICQHFLVLHCNYNGEMSQKWDLGITFDWRVLLT